VDIDSRHAASRCGPVDICKQRTEKRFSIEDLILIVPFVMSEKQFVPCKRTEDLKTRTDGKAREQKLCIP
jgi:hypothetical protein